MAQEAEAGAEDDGREQRRSRLPERERDQAEGDPGDRADPGGEAVEPVEQVDHVHDRDDPEHGQGHTHPLRQRVHSEDREREAVHPDPEAGRNRRGGELAGELLPPGEAAEIVDRADRGRDRGAEQQAAGLRAERQEGERRHEDPEEERQPAEPRNGPPVQPPRSRPVDHAEQPRHPADGRSQQHHDRQREPCAVEHLEVVGERLPHGYFVP